MVWVIIEGYLNPLTRSWLPRGCPISAIGHCQLAKSSLGRMVAQSSILNRRASGVRGNSK